MHVALCSIIGVLQRHGKRVVILLVITLLLFGSFTVGDWRVCGTFNVAELGYLATFD